MLSGDLDDNLRIQVRLKLALADIKDQQKQLNAEYKAGSSATGGAAMSTEDYTNNLLRLAKLELEAKDALQQFNLELRRTLKETNAAEGSYQQMTATLVRLNATYERLTEGERQSAQGRHML